uniref:Uncharacterized protein LOC111103675 n=1 Tax=Crassostrea virginica TaxID=6565 RepID=A0A8B8ANP4_CRAVI|nr:uncharacterized protein LOC111103675 [Crassostrea virginica]
MMENTIEVIFNSCFTFSIPVWVLLVVVILACWLLYWDKNFRLRINGKPRLVDVTYRSFTIEWDKPTFAAPSHYMVYFRKKSEHEKWECITTDNSSCSLEITDLPLNTEFVVKVRACTNTEHGPTGAESSPITTKNLAYKIRDASILRPGTENKLSVYDVPFHEEHDEQLKIRTIRIGESPEEDQTQSFKSVLMVSTPHSGKTTLLQGIMNFIIGVSYNDTFRLGFAREILDDV